MSYAYFHRDGKGAWHGYDAKTNAAIEAARPLEATLTLRYPDNPEKYRTFEIRFGAKAVSRRLKSPPTSGIIQVNVADENTRVVERRAVDTGGALPAAAAPVAAAQNRADDAAARHSGSKMDAASLVAALEEAATLPSKGLVGTYVQVSKWGGGAKDGDAVVLDEVGKSSFFASSPAASHRLRFAGGAEADALLRCREHATARAAKESKIPNFKGSFLGRFPLVSADFWTSDHLSERSRSVDAISGTRARGTLTLKRR